MEYDSCTRIISASQTKINQGNQLVHSPFLQSLSALAVGLDLDKVLCHTYRAKSNSISLPRDEFLVPEWSWLHCLAIATKAADALTYRKAFPQRFLVSDEESIDTEMAYQPMVCFFCCCCCFFFCRNLFSVYDIMKGNELFVCFVL